MTSPRKIAVAAASLGWHVIPCKADKRPLTDERLGLLNGLKDATTDPAQIREWWTAHPSALPAVVTGPSGLALVDVDVKDGKDGFAALQRLGHDIPATPIERGTPSGGRHYFYAALDGVDQPNGTSDMFEPESGIDRRTGNSYAVLYELPPKTLPALPAPPDWLYAERAGKASSIDRAPDADEAAFRERLAPGKPSKAVKEALDRVKSKGMSHADMLESVTEIVGLGTRGHRGVARALELARETYATGWPDAGQHWDNAVRGSIKRLGLPPATFKVSKAERKARKTATADKKGRAVTASDDDSLILEDGPLAEAIAPTLAETWAYAKGRGLMRYADGVWSRAEMNILEDDTRLLLREIEETRHRSASMRGDKAAMTKAMTLLSRNRAQNVAKFVVGILAKSEPVFDDHPHLLNVLNGVVDLRTGELAPHDAGLYLTNVAGARYKPGARHVDWDTTLTALSPKVRRWMQYRIGQAATGHPPDDTVIVIVKGGGANGKSTWLNAIKTAFGTYEVRAPEKLLLPGRGDHSTELASIAGARLVTVEELPEGRHINVKRAKDLAGTGTLTARFLFQDNFSFTPVNATLISTNYTPQLSEVDDGTWRRFELVDFSLKYVDDPSAPHERPKDRGLVGRMLAGKAGRAEAVLAWIVEGARLWYANGEQIPAPPQSVADAKTVWRSETDEVMAFAAERLTFGPDETVTSKAMADAMTSWLFGNGSRVWSHKTITARLEGHDLFVRNRVERKKLFAAGEQARGWIGVGLRPNEAVLDSFNSIVTAHK